jgi:ribokinase
MEITQMTESDGAPGRVFVFGSAHQDLVLSVPEFPAAGETVLATSLAQGFGGKGANQAIAAAAAGVSVTFIGTLGSDETGGRILANFADHGIDTSWTRLIEADPTGLAVVLVDGEGRNQIVVASGAGARLDSEVVDEVMRFVRAGDVVLVQCEIPVPIVEYILREAAATAALCVLNLAPYMPIDSAALTAAGLVIVNESEASALIDSIGVSAVDDPWSSISTALATSCIVTLGDKGSVFGASSGEVVRIPAQPVDDVVDTTGAGDVYVGTLGAHLARGATMPEAMAEASSAAATSVLSRGAQSRHPQSTATA